MYTQWCLLISVVLLYLYVYLPLLPHSIKSTFEAFLFVIIVSQDKIKEKKYGAKQETEWEGRSGKETQSGGDFVDCMTVDREWERHHGREKKRHDGVVKVRNESIHSTTADIPTLLVYSVRG